MQIISKNQKPDEPAKSASEKFEEMMAPKSEKPITPVEQGEKPLESPDDILTKAEKNLEKGKARRRSTRKRSVKKNSVELPDIPPEIQIISHSFVALECGLANFLADEFVPNDIEKNALIEAWNSYLKTTMTVQFTPTQALLLVHAGIFIPKIPKVKPESYSTFGKKMKRFLSGLFSKKKSGDSNNGTSSYFKK